MIKIRARFQQIITPQTHVEFSRLRVVPHFSSGIVGRAKRERA